MGSKEVNRKRENKLVVYSKFCISLVISKTTEKPTGLKGTWSSWYSGKRIHLLIQEMQETSSEVGNSKPLQYSCQENSMDRGAWQVIVHGVAQSRTSLSN